MPSEPLTRKTMHRGDGPSQKAKPPPPPKPSKPKDPKARALGALLQAGGLKEESEPGKG